MVRSPEITNDRIVLAPLDWRDKEGEGASGAQGPREGLL